MKYVILICMAVMATLACTAVKEGQRPHEYVPSQAVAEDKAIGLDAETRLDVELLVQHYQKHSPQKDESLARFAAIETARFGSLLGLGNDHLRDMLALWWTESTYRQNVEGDDGRSWGLTQVRLERIGELTKAWEPHGYDPDMGLGSVYDPTRQVAMGVMAYYIALKEARGDRFQALRRYNGGNKGPNSKAYKQAHAHAMRVMKARKAIFGL